MQPGPGSSSPAKAVAADLLGLRQERFELAVEVLGSHGEGLGSGGFGAT